MSKLYARRKRLQSVIENLELRQLLTSSTPFTADGSAWEITGVGTSTVEAENFDYGGEGVAYHDTNTGANQGGAYRPTEHVGVEGPSTNAGNTYNIGYVNAGEWLRYTIHVDTAGTYVVNLRASNANPTAAATHFTFNNSGTIVTSSSIAIPTTTGGWGGYTDHTASVTLSAGTQFMTLYDDTSGANFDYIGLTPASQSGSNEQSYNPTNPGNSPAVMRDVPTYLPAFGAAQIEAEYFDTGGQAAGASGVQTAGYYWLDQSKYTANYPYTATPFRSTDTIDMSDSGSGIVLNDWAGGDWSQYIVYSATNVAPTNPASTTPSYAPVSPTLTYQLVLNYSNSGTTTASFAIDDTSTDPSTGISTLSQLTTVSLPATAGNYQAVSTTITLPRPGLNTLRLLDNDAAGVKSGVSVDFLKLTNATTSGNNNVPWDVAANGSVTHIPADDVDVAPGSSVYPAGTNPQVAATGDTTGNGNDIKNLSAGDSVLYTITAELNSQYNFSIRVMNTGPAPATLQVTFDSGAAFGATPDPVVFSFNVPVGSGYQTITSATNISQLPQTVNNYVEIQSATQKMKLAVVTGTINFHYTELSNITNQPAVKPDSSQLGSYAYQTPDAALNSVGDLFDRVYNTHYDWINPPANATVPTNDWWTNLLVSQFAGDMYAYPQKLNDSATGVTFSGYTGVGTNTAGNTIIETGQQSIIVGDSGVPFTGDALLDYGDWTVHYRMQTAGSGYMDVTAGRGLPYTWYEYNSLTPLITLHTGSDANQSAFTIYDAAGNVQTGSMTTDHFRIDTGGEQIGVFAPAGTLFTRINGLFTVTFPANAAKYLVTALLPDSSNATLNMFYQQAYAVPRQVGSISSSKYTWTYSPIAGAVTTNWNLNLVAIDPASPPASLTTIQGWLPLDYTDGATGPSMLSNAASAAYVYPSINGNIKIAAGSSFSVIQTTNGINFELALPQTIGAPSVAYDLANPGATTVSTDYSPQQMLSYIKTYISQNTNTAATVSAGTTILNYGTDTYWGGKPLQEYAEFALMAKQIGDVNDYNIFVSNLTTFMTDWFTYTPGESNHYFAYYPSAHSLTGFNPAYGSENFTDNHFHYGYFTAAAGVLAMLNPTWASQYGQMAKMVAMQYANWLHSGDTPDVTDPNAISLPFLRTFEPWVGHSYAGGTSSGGGNNQESSSEAIQSWLGIVMLGQALNDPAMTAAGMMGYTMESKAVREQWFNQAPGSANTDGLAFPSSFSSSGQQTTYSNVAIDFDGGKNYATYFGANPEYILGIEALPIWPSLDFLGKNAPAAAAATQSMLNQRAAFFNNAADNTFASFETGGENDWLNIALGFQSQYDPQATALQYARMIAQQTPTGITGSTGLYYFQDHSYQTYGLRDWNYHLSIPLGGVYTHATDSTLMSGTRSYMAYNPGTTSTTVYVYDSSGNAVDSFVATPGFNIISRSVATGHAPPIIVDGATISPSPIKGTSAQLSVLANDEQQVEANITYSWSMSAGPTGAVPLFSNNGTNAAKNTTVTFNLAGSYTFNVVATDVNGLSISTAVNVVVQSTLAAISVYPGTASLITNGTQMFSAIGIDQFGTTLTNPAVVWSIVSGGGTISTAGLFQAPGSAGNAVVKASSGDVNGTASITISLQIAAPTGLVAAMKNTSEIDLSWTAPSGTVTGYFIFRGTTPRMESAVALNTAAVTSTSYKDFSVLPNTSYFYTVKAVNTGGSSLASNEASASTATDLALNKPAYSSANENNTLGPALAFDGSNATRWSSAFSDPQFIYVDLGGIVNIAEVKLNWENAAGKNYEIDVSNDAATWTSIKSVTGNTTAGWKDYQGLNSSGRYIRMEGTARTTQYGYSLFDFNVYGSAPATALSLTGSQYLELDATVYGQLDVWSATTNAGNPTRTYMLSQISSISASAVNSNDQITVDFSRGNPLATMSPGLNLVGLTGGSNSLIIKGDNSGDNYQFSAGLVSVNGAAITFSKMSAMFIQSGTGNDSYHQTTNPLTTVNISISTGSDSVRLDANAGSEILTAPLSSGVAVTSLSSLFIGAGSQVSFVSAPGQVSHSVMAVSSLSIAGSSGHWLGLLDLNNNDLLIQTAGYMPTAVNQIQQGAVTSSTASSNTTHLTTLGILINDDGGGNPIFGPSKTFDGLSPSVGYTLIKYTYFGDLNLDGKVDGGDYTRIDNGYLNNITGWQNGDLNFDGVIDGSDYTLIDNAFNRQATAIPSAAIARVKASNNLTLSTSDQIITDSSSFDIIRRRHKRVFSN